MKKINLFIPILLLFSGAASAIPVSGFTLQKVCGADTTVCDTYSSLPFSFDIFVDNTASGFLPNDTYSVPLIFEGQTGLSNLRQDAVVTITETLPSAAWADVVWNPICTVANGVGAASTSSCFSYYDDSVPNQVSFSLTTEANGDTLLIQAVNSPVPVPAAVWLFGSGLLGLVGIARRKKAA